MTIKAKILAHSSHEDCAELITLELRYPRFIHAEFLTHRAFSRNSSSSRAIPVERMIADVEADIAMPVSWGRNQKGMQAGADIDDVAGAKDIWLAAAKDAVKHAKYLANKNAHKQIVNRILEPYAHISTVVTATDWGNFFALRLDEAADPTIRALAKEMKKAIAATTATHVTQEQWHMPYGGPVERSVAACARVSYLNHDKTEPNMDMDTALFSKLLAEGHLSPFEHIAKPSPKEKHGNLNGWRSIRSLITREIT